MKFSCCFKQVKTIFLFRILSVFFCFLYVSTFCNAAPSVSWHTLETKYTKIVHQYESDFIKLESEIEYAHDWQGQSLSESVHKDFKVRLSHKVDVLFERVQQILDMRSRTKKVKIKIYPDKKALRLAYFALFYKKCRLKAWYLFERNTVYVTVEDIHAGMLAHELAHAIIDHYFSVRPPKATAEILARYVDKHLEM